ncbi:hypothetical protein PQX77_001505 [Marasmius sp. AFHP31]|nr:hypothetical protein PQX77_001505 [Marasmius sp. AFHP31]
MHGGCSIVYNEGERKNLSPLGRTLPSSLRTLKLGGADDSVETAGLPLYYHWLRTGIPPTLLSLSIHTVDIDWEDSVTHPDPDIEPLLRRCAGLQCLHFGFDAGSVFDSATAFYDLSVLLHLKHLIVSIRNLEPGDHDSLLLDLIRKMFSTISSPSLITNVFNVSAIGFRVLKERWDAFDVLLATAKFATVQVELTIPFSDSTLRDGTSEEDLSRARQVFPRCDKKGRLSITRAPFTVKAKDFDGSEDSRDFQDYDVINWVCGKYFV